MPISVKPGESQSEFTARCVPEMIGTGEDKRPQEQAVAACLQVWRDRNKKQSKQVEPEDGESYDEFMSRCMDEVGDEAECEIAWENRQAPAVVHKTHVGRADGAEYILSDETPDRMGDVISAAGWDLTNFNKHPIALFNHRADFPIGTWSNVHVKGNALHGSLELAPDGTSDRIDEIRRLVNAGILKAVSVGFKPTKHEPINKEDPRSGFRFLSAELVETSLVSVPANPNALAVAKSLAISEPTMRLVFAEQGSISEKQVRRGFTAEQGRIKTPHNGKTRTMSVLSQNIVAAQGRINVLSDALKAHLENQDNENVSDADLDKTTDLNARLRHERKHLETLLESEKNLGGDTATAGNGSEGAHEVRLPARRIESPTGGSLRVYAEAGKKHQPGDHVWKSLTALVKMQGDRYRKSSALDVLRDTVGENDQTRAVFTAIIGKAASVPALTTATGWAVELVRTEIAAFLESLKPNHVFASLAAKGLTFSFGNAGIISIPMRSATPTIAGSFVGEGAPIPVRQGAFQAIQLVPKKMAVITTFSREISEHSDPAIEGLLREAIVDDTATAIDSVLLDSNAATAVRPAGLRNGVSTLSPTAGANYAAVVGDVKLLVGALLASTLGNIRSPVWLMTPKLTLALRLTVAPNGVQVFAEDIGRGTFLGYPVIESSLVTADTIYLIDAADFISVAGTEPRFDVSDSATVHMEDTTPLAIGTAGTPATVAAPVRSFWQTDTLGIRMLMQMNWALRRTGMVQYITSPTWI